ncbi:MAG: endonuclease/exonuclease/phosphatase family protein [Bacteroidota bacterium]|nr:endonuclease/exonuclease/phosphatase family protein [Bacteroidota bacterium]
MKIKNKNLREKILILVLISTNITTAQNLNNLSFGSDTTFEIVSWNIEWFPKNNNTANYVQTILTNLESDIYALQEISDTSLLKTVVANIGNYECHFNSAYYGGLTYVYNTNTVQINAKYEIYTSQPYWNAFPRSPQVLDLNFNGTNYIIINNHLKCCGDGILNINNSNDEENRRLQAITLLKEYIDNNFSNKKVIVLGDLNDELTDITSNNVFGEIITDNENYLFTDMQIAEGSNNNWSYPTWPSHLDHILITNELFIDFQNPNSEINVIKIDDYMNNWYDYENNISDHRPIGLKLYLNHSTLISESIKNNEKAIQTTDILGRKTNKNTKGIMLQIFKNGKVKKILSNTQYR